MWCFSKSEINIEQIESLKLKTNVTDLTLVCKPYRKIPIQVYSKGKQYIEELQTNEWIKTSYSSYASPMVYVRKRDGCMRLCLDYRDLNKRV